MADDLRDARAAIERQIGELEGHIKRLRGAIAYIDEVKSSDLNGLASTRESAQMPKRSMSTSARRPKKTTPSGRAGHGERQRQFLDLVGKHPGARAGEIAKEMGVTPNQVHGLAHRLTQAGQIRKQGRGGYALVP